MLGLRKRVIAESTEVPSTIVGALDVRLEKLGQVLDRVSLPLLRSALGVVYIWFGVLKFAGSSPVGNLVAATVPFLPAHWFVPALGIFETLLGLALLLGRRMELVVFVMIAHLAGTFLVLVAQPAVSFQGDNPLRLTMTGEFVVKNLVLMTAGLVLAVQTRRARDRAGDRASDRQDLPGNADDAVGMTVTRNDAGSRTYS